MRWAHHRSTFCLFLSLRRDQINLVHFNHPNWNLEATKSCIPVLPQKKSLSLNSSQIYIKCLTPGSRKCLKSGWLVATCGLGSGASLNSQERGEERERWALFCLSPYRIYLSPPSNWLFLCTDSSDICFFSLSLSIP